MGVFLWISKISKQLFFRILLGDYFWIYPFLVTEQRISKFSRNFVVDSPWENVTAFKNLEVIITHKSLESIRFHKDNWPQTETHSEPCQTSKRFGKIVLSPLILSERE